MEDKTRTQGDVKYWKTKGGRGIPTYFGLVFVKAVVQDVLHNIVAILILN